VSETTHPTVGRELSVDDIDFGPLSRPAPEAAHEMLHPGESYQHHGAISVHAALTNWRNRAIQEETVPRLTTGFASIDRATRGLQPGECFDILARTGSGKTHIVGNIADHILRERPTSAVLVVNLEMPAAQLIGRLLRMHFRRTDEYIERAARADNLDIERFVQLRQNLFFLDRGAVSLEQIQRAAEDLRRQIAPTPLEAVFVDHCGLVRVGRSGSAYERATETAIGLKQMARQLGTIVFAVVQANRAGKQDVDPVPLESARDSGAYEENCDFLLALGKIVDSPALAGRPFIKARLAKNRRGPEIPVTLTFDPLALRVEELEEGRG
jgi:replicative DNA helicase